MNSSSSRWWLMIVTCSVLLIPMGLARAQEPGRWSFAPAPDTFSAESWLDLRYLNEKTAGESGFVKRSADGNDFVLGNGLPVRFWAVNDSGDKDRIDLAHQARFLAKRGVNMVRWHGDMVPKGPNARPTDFDRTARDHCWALVAAMKKEGIYTTLSPYWANTLHIPASWGIAGPPGQSADGLLFWNKSLQQDYKAWLKGLLTEKNPYTGIALAQDPALAIISLQNEDSMLFWTLQSISKEQKEELAKIFGQWLIKKYGSLDKARAAWAGDTMPEDHFDRGLAGSYMIWELTQARSGGRAKRLADQLEFYADAMHQFNADMGEYLHKELGCRQMINAGNWKTADDVKLGDVERYTYTANQVIAVNRYYDGGVHIGAKPGTAGWCISVGDHFTSVSALLEPRGLPTNLKQVDGFPMIITESNWVPPMAYQAEGPFLTAAYQSLSGIDAFYWFADGAAEWQQPASANGYVPAIGKWVCATPEIMGQFPAAALMYRRSYIRQGETAVHEERSLDDLWNRRTPIIAEDRSYDPNRDSGDIAGMSNIKHGVNPLAFLVGPVVVRFGGDPSHSHVVDLSKFIDEAHKTVRSITGEIVMNYGAGFCTIDAPKAQGACGFLSKAGPIKLKDIEIDSGNAYGAVTVVSMDDAVLATSKRILVQVGTQSRPTGWKEIASQFKGTDGKTIYRGSEITALGKAPWSVVDTDVTLKVKNASLTKATLLDLNGMPIGNIPVEHGSGLLKLKLPPNTMYAVLQ